MRETARHAAAGFVGTLAAGLMVLEIIARTI